MLTVKQGLLTVASLCLSTTVMANAYYHKRQFYPSVVFLTKSNPCVAVVYVQALVFVWLIGKVMGKLFFGQLRPAELEHLFERSWYAVTETCLAFTVFRDDFSPKFIALFTLLLFLKCFHWLAEDRVDFMERSPNISLLFHVRVLSLLCILSLQDFAFVRHAYYSVTTMGASVQVVFGFEYAILLSTVLYIFIKYVLHSIDSRAETQWENKAVLLLHTELLMSLSKVILYATFMVVMLRIHTFPLFAIRPMYLSIRALKRAFKDVVLSRQAINNMNTLYPDATAEELSSADNVCIICREEMVGGGNKKLPCNHIFHAACLRSWFQRQQTCPTCRSDVLNTGRNQADRAPRRDNEPNANGNNPPLNLPNFQAFFANWQRHNMPPGNNNNQHNNAAGGGPPPNGAAQGAASSSSAPSGPTIPPPPPFMLLPPMFLPPPPPIIPSGLNLATLTEEELHCMEGNERRAVESRIQNLRNIQILLDAAVTMMGQYNAALNATQHYTGPASGSGEARNGAGSSGQENGPPDAGAGPSTSAQGADSNQASQPEAGSSVQPPSASSSSSVQQPQSSQVPPVPAAPTPAPGEIDANEVRRRRVEKLLSANGNSGAPGSGNSGAPGSGSGGSGSGGNEVSS